VNVILDVSRKRDVLVVEGVLLLLMLFVFSFTYTYKYDLYSLKFTIHI